ncbi:hypothetical protein ARMGADRAFT_1034489 [Armillaria gallica]|uniref:Uncharacterized protein n=1 Tax=Armillaria gallica TaxID=47427 RepID=A0A2H3D2B3_ARMGA|nr:hypothetical protein ARMGADRAFT_1034488 [Armillaria gallica]PBK87884.1 hypothetical protein ARMGADRAFT_1034489 [Armillaria gallica]
MQSALTCLHEITDAGDGQQANAFMWAIINNLWISIGSTPNPILSARYPTKLVGQHLLCWIKEFLAHNRVYKACHSHMRHTDNVIYESYSVETANNALIKQVILFLDPNWFGCMTPFMCAEYMRIHDINNYRKMQAFEQAYEVEVGELGPEGVYSAVLMPVLKVTSNSAIISDWEAYPNGGMADKWESDDEGEEEGISAADLQAGHDFYSLELGDLCTVDPPLHVADPSSFGSRDRSAYNCMITHHARSSDLNEGTPSGVSKEEDSGGLGLQGRPKVHGNQLCESPNWLKYDWLEKPEHSGLGCISVPEDQEASVFQLAEWKLAWRNVVRSKESIVLSKEVADDDGGMFQEHFEENLRWKYRNSSGDTCEGIVFLTRPLLKMSALPNFTNFTFHCGQGVPSDWTKAHAQSLYNSILADPIQHNKNIWMPTHIHWMMNSDRQSNRHGCICSVKAAGRHLQVDPPFHPAVLPSFCQDLSNLMGEYWLATSDPVSSDADTGPSDSEANEDKDMGYGAVQPPTIPMDEDPTPS